MDGKSPHALQPHEGRTPELSGRNRRSRRQSNRHDGASPHLAPSRRSSLPPTQPGDHKPWRRNSLDVPDSAGGHQTDVTNASDDGQSVDSFASHISAMHLAESYSRPVFVLGARPTLMTLFDEPLPVGYLTREERQVLDQQEQTLLERNEIIPSRSAMLDTLMECREPEDFEAALDTAADETTSLLGAQEHRAHGTIPEDREVEELDIGSGMNGGGGNYGHSNFDRQSIRAYAEGVTDAVDHRPETTRQERRKAWEEAVQQQAIETSWRYEAKLMVTNSAPLVMTFILQFSMQMSSILSLGHLGRTELAAASLASMTASITMISFTQGIATSLDTLCAQSFGANMPHLVGLHLQRCMLLLALCLVPVGALWLASERVFVALHQPPEVAALAALYLRVLLLGAPAYVGFEALKRFTAAQGHFRVSTYALFVSAPLNAVLNYVLVWHPRLGFGFAGAPASMAIAYWSMLLQMVGYIKYGRSRHAWHGFDQQAFSDWGPMLRLAGPGCLMTCSEWFAYEVMALASSLLGVVPLGAQAILSTTGSLVYQIPFALSVGVSVRVGNLLGAGLARPAQVATRVACAMSILIGLALALVLLAVRHDWGRLFSDDAEVIALAAAILPLNAVFNLADTAQCVTAGVLRGQGRQHIGGVLNLGAYYVVAIPLGLWLAFEKRWALTGLWTGMAVATVGIAIAQAVAVLQCDPHDLVERVQRRILASAAHRQAK